MELATGRGLTAALRSRGYQVRGPAGVGAGGTAWAANAPDGRRVVVGVLDLDVTLAERRAALARLETLRGIEHPHLVRLVDVIALDGHRTALVSEAVEGPTVGAVLSVRARWVAGEVTTLVVPLAGALAALHDAGLVHGDVAPENVVLAPGGRPVLVDLAGIVLPGGGTKGFAPPRGRGEPGGDVVALARLGLATLGSGADGEEPEDRSLRSVLEAAADACPEVTALASACFDVARPVPVEIPDAAVLTRVALTRFTEVASVERTLPDPRVRRRRRVAGVVAGAVAAIVLGIAVTLVLPARHEVADVALVAIELTQRRAEVLTSRDPARLSEVMVEGSPAFSADEALMASLASSGEGPEVSATVLDSRWLGAREGRELVALTSTHRWGTTAAEPRHVVLALVETADGWRVVDVLDPEAVGAATGPVGPLAG